MKSNINNRTHALSLLALTVSAAMMLSFVESQIPAFVPIPGIKIGLANIAVIFALYDFGVIRATFVSLIRVFLVALLFGNITGMIYGLFGAVFSLAIMAILKKRSPLSCVGVSVTGAVAHNVGQILAAWLLIGNEKILLYLPILVISGTLSGIAIGIASGILIKRLKNL
jgi:heptaprenyl diphosphate synthase